MDTTVRFQLGYFITAFRLSLLALAALLLLPASAAQAHPEALAENIKKSRRKAAEGDLKPQFTLKPVLLAPTAPVHEDMLKQSFNLSNIHNRIFNDRADPSSEDVNYIKGVYWPDSPERGLCKWCSPLAANWRAPQWYRRFRAAKAEVERTGTYFDHGADIFERSHYGDLAVIHSMAVTDGIAAAETKRRLMIWVEFLYGVAVGKISPATRISDVQVADFSEIFNARDTRNYNKTVQFLFSDPNVPNHVYDARQNSIGALLHLIQDSYSPAHTRREIHDGEEGRFCRGTITRFLAYPNQAVSKHSTADKWPVNLPRNMLPANARICDPITAGAAMLKLYAANDFAGAPWPEAKKFLDEVVFALAADALPSGPGDEFAR